MKKTLSLAAAIIMVFSLLCTGALAKGNGQPEGGGGQQQGGNPPQNGGGMQNNTQPGQGGQMGGMSIDVDAVTTAIATLTDTTAATNLTALLETYKTAAAGNDANATMEAMQAVQEALTAAGLQVQGGGGMPMNGGQAGGTQYGRFLDMDKMAAAIAAMTDTDAAANLTALLATYQTAVQSQNQEEVQTALQALFAAMNQTQTQDQTEIQMQAQTQTETQTQPQPQGDFGPVGMNADECMYLDTDAVAAAIAALTDTDAAAKLSSLLEAYNVALIADDSQTLQSAFTALMIALSEAGIA